MWLETWLSDYSKVEDVLYTYVDSSLLISPDHFLSNFFRKKFGFTKFYNVPVQHSYPAYGLIIEHQSNNTTELNNDQPEFANTARKEDETEIETNFQNKVGNSRSEAEKPSIIKVVYSGDTRPGSDLVKFGLDADLLIHEATFGDDLQTKALSDRHSTLTEAIDQSIQMKAKLTILTHFSTRFESLAPDILGLKSEKVFLAFDLLTIPMSSLNLLQQFFPSHLLPLLIQIFHERNQQLLQDIHSSLLPPRDKSELCSKRLKK